MVVKRVMESPIETSWYLRQLPASGETATSPFNKPKEPTAAKARVEVGNGFFPVGQTDGRTVNRVQKIRGINGFGVVVGPYQRTADGPFVP